MRVTGFDHVVLNVRDVERSLRFYCDELGLEPVRVDEWRAGQAPFPSVRVSPDTIIDLVANERTGHNVDHLCLVVEPLDWADVVASGRFRVVDGPATRFGARGDGESLYVEDPDGNVVELRYYRPS
ncbi:MAG: VOC family protein [Frankia sp.]|nr:VOC family protein [Frankia sp.]